MDKKHIIILCLTIVALYAFRVTDHFKQHPKKFSKRKRKSFYSTKTPLYTNTPIYTNKPSINTIKDYSRFSSETPDAFKLVEAILGNDFKYLLHSNTPGGGYHALYFINPHVKEKVEKLLSKLLNEKIKIEYKYSENKNNKEIRENFAACTDGCAAGCHHIPCHSHLASNIGSTLKLNRNLAQIALDALML